MIKSAELKGPSCLTKAANDEPLFVLRANDPLAPQLVREWSQRYFEAKRQGYVVTDAQRIKIQDALAIANAMEEWKSTDRDAMNT